jgi:hypothetical protein
MLVILGFTVDLEKSSVADPDPVGSGPLGSDIGTDPDPALNK